MSWLGVSLALLGAALLLWAARRARDPRRDAPTRTDKIAWAAGWGAVALGLATLAKIWFRHSCGNRDSGSHRPPDTKDLFS